MTSPDQSPQAEETLAYVHIRDRWWVRAREWVAYRTLKLFRDLAWPLPLWTLTGAFAPLGGWVVRLVPAFRRRVENNLSLVWPHLSAGERRRILIGAGKHTMRMMVEYTRIDKFRREVVLNIDGAERLEAARASGKGMVLVTAHYGNWEAARAAAQKLGHESGIIYRAFNNRYLDAFTMNLLPCLGTPVLQKGRKGTRQLLAHVARGGVAMILVDQRNSGAPFIPFLGHPAETVTAAADLAVRTGAALMPVVARRNVAERRFDVCFEAPVTGSDATEMMAEVNRRIGAWVEADPEQWFWFHRRWRSTTRSREE